MKTKILKSIWLPITVLTLLTVFSSCQKEPTASFSVSSTSIEVGESVIFTNTSGDGDSYEWDFGDGSTSTTVSPTHTYNTAGTYTVTLTAFSKNGKKSDKAAESITVSDITGQAPVANFTADTTSITEGGTVNFSDISTNTPTSWSWDFGDSGTSTLQNPSHTYSTVGTYTVSLTATNSYGSDTETKIDYISVTYNHFTDIRDGQTYNTVQIGSQCWMAENLNYDAGSGSWCYNDNASNCTTYGRLYTWATALTVAPAGWHLPTDEEWKTLEMELGMSQADADATGYRGTDEGGKLKETGTTHWNSPNTGATNSSGFTALPGGHWGLSGLFHGLGEHATFWTATESNSSNAWHHSLYYDGADVRRDWGTKTYGLSVRCVKD